MIFRKPHAPPLLVGHIRSHRITQMCCAFLPSFSNFGFKSFGNTWPAACRCGNEGGVPYVQAVRQS